MELLLTADVTVSLLSMFGLVQTIWQHLRTVCTYSDPKVTYSDPKVTYSYPKVT